MECDIYYTVSIDFSIELTHCVLMDNYVTVRSLNCSRVLVVSDNR